MHNIALPKNYSLIKGDNENNVKIVVEPCFPGFGITIGNAIRRVLLSSLPGCAVIGAKIEGVEHEFMAIPHLKEDILELLMNLKQLRLKILSDEEEIKMKLEVNGKKKVKASDITKDATFEIINKDLEIANITDMAGKLNIEITARKGIGYETIENRDTDKKEIGFIEIDSIFSPIVNVGIKIENARVGKMTNWDKLVIDLTTDGTITPDDAFAYANKVLIDQFNALAEISTGEIAETIEDKQSDKNSDDEKEEANEEDEVEEKKSKRGRPKKGE